MGLLGTLGKSGNGVLLYNTAPEITTVYFATTDPRLATKLKVYFELEEIDSIDYKRDFLMSSNRQWGIEGNGSLVNFN